MNLMNCPFCNLNIERNPVLKTGKYFKVIISNPQLMPGHLLIIPIRHMEKVTELSNDEQKELFLLIKEFEEKILKNISSGCDLRQNYRPFEKASRTKVNHLHFHLQPREENDKLYNKANVPEKTLFTDVSSEELRKIQNFFS